MIEFVPMCVPLLPAGLPLFPPPRGVLPVFPAAEIDIFDADVGGRIMTKTKKKTPLNMQKINATSLSHVSKIIELL